MYLDNQVVGFWDKGQIKLISTQAKETKVRTIIKTTIISLDTKIGVKGEMVIKREWTITKMAEVASIFHLGNVIWIQILLEYKLSFMK